MHRNRMPLSERPRSRWADCANIRARARFSTMLTCAGPGMPPVASRTRPAVPPSNTTVDNAGWLAGAGGAVGTLRPLRSFLGARARVHGLLVRCRWCGMCVFSEALFAGKRRSQFKRTLPQTHKRRSAPKTMHEHARNNSGSARALTFLSHSPRVSRFYRLSFLGAEQSQQQLWRRWRQRWRRRAKYTPANATGLRVEIVRLYIHVLFVPHACGRAQSEASTHETHTRWSCVWVYVPSAWMFIYWGETSLRYRLLLAMSAWRYFVTFLLKICH